MMWPRWRRVFLVESYGWDSPATAPHIWQVKPLRSKTSALSSFEMLLSNAGCGLLFSNRYSPGFKSLRSLWVRIWYPSSFLNSRTRRAHSLFPAISLSSSDVMILPIFSRKCARSLARIPMRFGVSSGGVKMRGGCGFARRSLGWLAGFCVRRRAPLAGGKHFQSGDRPRFFLQRTANRRGILGSAPSCAE